MRRAIVLQKLDFPSLSVGNHLVNNILKFDVVWFLINKFSGFEETNVHDPIFISEYYCQDFIVRHCDPLDFRWWLNKKLQCESRKPDLRRGS